MGVTDSTGALKDTVTYDAYGNFTETNQTWGGMYKYAGREFDSTTGLQYNRARWYDATTGRWMNQDLMGFDAGDSNLYRYVKNMPTNRTDTSGFESDAANCNGDDAEFQGEVRILGNTVASAYLGTYTNANGREIRSTPAQVAVILKHDAMYNEPTECKADNAISLTVNDQVDPAASTVIYETIYFSIDNRKQPSKFVTFPIPITSVTLNANGTAVNSFKFSGSEWYPDLPMGQVDRGLTGDIDFVNKKSTLDAKYQDKASAVITTYTGAGQIK